MISLFPTIISVEEGLPENHEELKENFLKRLNLQDYREDELLKILKFDAIFIMHCSPNYLNALQIISDILSTKDGSLLGPKRT